MRRPSILLGPLAFAGAAGLLYLLVRSSHVDLHGLLETLADVHPAAVLLIAVSMGLMAWCSSEKWRQVRLRTTAGGGAMPRNVCFGCTALGMALGQLFPAQVATSITRGIGLRFTRRGTMINAAGMTIFEQSFDLLIAVFAASSTVLLLLLRFNSSTWLVLTVIGLTVGIAATYAAAGIVARSLLALGPLAWRRWPRTEQAIGLLANVLQRMQAVGPALVWRLSMLSVLRYCALIVSAYAVALAGELPISLFQIAAAVPLVVLAVLVSFAPGGLGVNEWTYASTLVAVGVPFPTAVGFALLNRILNLVGAMAVGAAGCLAMVRR